TPANPATTPEAAAPAPAPNVAATSGNIVDIASASESFKTLVAALNEAELAQVLEGTGPFTVFAPTDAAFEALPAGTFEELLKPENRATLVQILKYHVVSGSYPSASLESGQLPTAAGVPLTVTVANGSVKVDGATVLQPDINASNGVIHAIDQVILPSQPQR
ncbi:MAG: fasciclin domain-containing protein, partial [Elainella sp.]